MATSYAFAVNLRPDTYDSSFRQLLRPWGYLLAPNNATGRTRAMAAELSAHGGRLIADNGNFALIGKVVAELAEEANVLLARVRSEERVLGRRVRRGDVSPGLQRDCTALAVRASDTAVRNALPSKTVLQQQRLLEPSHLVGPEDISMAVWLALNLEPEYLSFDRSVYRRHNSKVAKTAAAQMSELSRTERAAFYPVASALSYDTAYDAGVEFARHGIRRVAMGFGAYMADNHSGEHIYIRSRRIDFPDLVPMRYVRTACVARGFWDGYRSHLGSPPLALHCLGLGAPIMLPLVALAAWGTNLLTFDAMSPIKDAVEGTVYLSKPSFLKARTRRQALRLASSEGERWLCPCPFCRDFVRKHPFDYGKGRRWFLSARRSEVTAGMLRPGGALYDAYPLLSEPRSGLDRTAVSVARVGHNHWVLARIIQELTKAGSSRRHLEDHVDGLVSAYETRTSSETYSTAVRLAFEIVGGRIPA